MSAASTGRTPASVPYWQDHAFELHVGDVRTALSSFPEGCVQTCVTSPPYWGLRDYGVEGQLGLESTPEAYVQALVGVFRGVRRVLAEDGTLWLNLGDSYVSSPPGNKEGVGATSGLNGANSASGRYRETLKAGHATARNKVIVGGLPPKNLIGIPWRVALALQADGWILRSDIIWAKRSPLPESVTDRPTKAHEYLFLLAKQPRYYYDAEAIAEDMVGQNHHDRTGMGRRGVPGQADHTGTRHRAFKKTKRNKRTVWTLSAQPTPEAHFAVFPEKLVVPCVLAGSRPGDVVLDPFMGSGTTAIVARSLGRQALGVELNPEYADIAVRRYTTGKLVLR